MKNFLKTGIVCFVLLTTLSCTKDGANLASEVKKQDKTRKIIQMRAMLPNELLEEPIPVPPYTVIYSCPANPWDCGPWIIVKAGKEMPFTDFTEVVAANDVRDYFNNGDYSDLFETFDSELVEQLSEGLLVISEVPATDGMRIFIVHHPTDVPNAQNAIIALPFDTVNEE